MILDAIVVYDKFNGGVIGRYGRGFGSVDEAKMPVYVVYVFAVIPDVLCFIGACTKIKYLLVPFIVKTGYLAGIVMCFIVLIAVISSDFGSSFVLYSVMLGLCIYSCATACKFLYKKSNTTSRRSEEIMLQPISSEPTARRTEVVPSHLHSVEQTQTYEHQEKPPAYQSQDDLERNVGIKSDCCSIQV